MNKSLLGSLFDMIRRFRFRVIIACLMIFISNGLLILNPLIFRQALAALFPSNTPSNYFTSVFKTIFHSYFHSLMPWALLLVSLAIISALLKYFMRLTFLAISREVELEIRAKLFERIQSQSKAFFDRHGIGDLISRLTNDITAYRDVLGPGMMFPLFFISLVIPAYIALFFLSPLLASISLIPIMGGYIVNLFIRKPMFQVSHQVQESLSDMSRMVHEHYSGIRLIKSYGIEQATFHLFERLCKVFGAVNMQLACFQGLFAPILNLMTKLVILTNVLLAGAIILLGWGPLSLADFLSFVWIQSYVFIPLTMLGWVIPLYQKGKAAYARLVEIYEEPIEVYQFHNALEHLPPHASIEFCHLNFTYPNQQRPAIQDLSLNIKGGTFVGITGPVGAGKTTLFRLLDREYEVPEGTIWIGDKDIHAYTLNAFHRELVSVEQLPFLFSKSIGENVKFGKQDATQEEIEWVSKQVDLHQSILEFPERYETLVGERGVSLSGGQKQRVAMARAFLVNRSILLLDDIFSAVDAATEQRIFQAMKENFIGKTILLITQRASILEQLDRILYMKEGCVVEDGTPQELIKRHGLYRALIDLQKMQRYDPLR